MFGGVRVFNSISNFIQEIFFDLYADSLMWFNSSSKDARLHIMSAGKIPVSL